MFPLERVSRSAPLFLIRYPSSEVRYPVPGARNPLKHHSIELSQTACGHRASGNDFG